MIDKNIKRFCELVIEISSKNKELDNERLIFEYGGHEFEDVYEYDIRELYDLQNEFRELLKTDTDKLVLFRTLLK